MAHACNPRTQEAETGLSRLHCKFQTNLGYGEPLSKKKKKLFAGVEGQVAEAGTLRRCHCGKANSPGMGKERVFCGCVTCMWKWDRSAGAEIFGQSPGLKGL